MNVKRNNPFILKKKVNGLNVNDDNNFPSLVNPDLVEKNKILDYKEVFNKSKNREVNIRDEDVVFPDDLDPKYKRYLLKNCSRRELKEMSDRVTDKKIVDEFEKNMKDYYDFGDDIIRQQKWRDEQNELYGPLSPYWNTKSLIGPFTDDEMSEDDDDEASTYTSDSDADADSE